MAIPDTHPFDRLTAERLRATPSAKWQQHDPGVLPLWVADMDFPVADAIREAVTAHVRDHPFVYPPEHGVPGLREALAERLGRDFGWCTEPHWSLPLPGIVPGLYATVRALTAPGDGVLSTTPIYPPIQTAVTDQGRVLQAVDLRPAADGYRLDADALAAAVTPATRMLLLCNPHNPTGRVFDRAELEAVAEVALEHRLWVVSDELHADLRFERPHLAFAALAPEVEQRTVVLYGPTKAFNIAGLKVGFAVSGNAALRERLQACNQRLLPPPNVLAQVAARAALRDADDWLADTLAYLRSNRERLLRWAEAQPGVRMQPPEATYLAWLDLRDAGLGDAPAAALLERARVALNEGAAYGDAGRGFARLNFATSRALLDEALARLGDALERTPEG